MKRKGILMVMIFLAGIGLTGCMWLFPPLLAVLTANPTSGAAPLTVTFDPSGSTGPIVSFTLDFGDGSTPYTHTDITVPIVHTYNTAGTYTARLTVVDSRGRTNSDTVTITVTAPPSSTVSLGAVPTSGSAPLAVNFWATITAAPGEKIVYLKLEFGDGSPDFEADVNFASYDWWLVNHTYAAGSYTATLTVLDSGGGTASDSVLIIVTSPPPEITAFSATCGPDTVNFDDPDPTLVITSGDTVDFDFQADAATGRKIKKWTLSCPGSNVPFAQEDDLSEDPLVRTNLLRTYTHDKTQTQSYTATLKVWDDIGNWDEAVIYIEVGPAP